MNHYDHRLTDPLLENSGRQFIAFELGGVKKRLCLNHFLPLRSISAIRRLQKLPIEAARIFRLTGAGG